MSTRMDIHITILGSRSRRMRIMVTTTTMTEAMSTLVKSKRRH